MKERYQVWVEKITKKELALIEEAEKRARERKVDIERDMKTVSDSIEEKGVSLKALEGSSVWVSQCVLSNFPNAYKYTPYGTVVMYLIKGGRPHVRYVERNHTEKRITWNFTQEAKKAIIKASSIC